jgi:FMN phosphatase YigB (HAD superfamily)
MLTAVLFDLYETLVTEGGANPVRASSLGPRLGLDAVAFRKLWKLQRSRVIRGQLPFADALIEVGGELNQQFDPVVVHSLCVERAREKSVLFGRFNPDALTVLRQLRQRGLKLAVVSNCFAEDVEGWPRCGAAQLFDTSVFSFDVGAAKPERQIYLEAVHRLGIESGSAVFVGDGGDGELLGAERAGLRAAQATWYRGERVGLPAHIPRLPSWQAVLDLATAG